MSLEHVPLEEPEVSEVVRRRTEQEFGPLTEMPAVATSTRRSSRWGIAVGATILLAVVMANRPGSWTLQPGPSAAPLVAVAPETVPVGSVSYGPDIWPGGVVDPSFRPGGPLPQGLAVSATVGMTVWGCGDHKASGAQPPEGLAAQQIEERLLELVTYVRDEVRTRKLPAPDGAVPKEFRTALPSVLIGLGLEWRNGAGGTTIAVPIESGPRENVELRRIVRLAAKRMTDGTADSIQWMRENDPNLP